MHIKTIANVYIAFEWFLVFSQLTHSALLILFIIPSLSDELDSDFCLYFSPTVSGWGFLVGGSLVGGSVLVGIGVVMGVSVSLGDGLVMGVVLLLSLLGSVTFCIGTVVFWVGLVVFGSGSVVFGSGSVMLIGSVGCSGSVGSVILILSTGIDAFVLVLLLSSGFSGFVVFDSSSVLFCWGSIRWIF